MSAIGTVPAATGRIPIRVTGADPLSAGLIGRIDEACGRAEDATGTPMVVVTLHGTGYEGEWPGDVGVHMVNKWERALRRLERLNAVTVAVADGACHGPLLEILLATDYRIAAPDSRFAFPSYAGEAWPGMAMHRLANQLGVARARRLVLFGAELTATEAHAAGLVDAVAADPSEQLDTLADSVRATTGRELAIRRRLLLDATATSFEESLGVHLAACDRALLGARNQDDQEAVS